MPAHVDILEQHDSLKRPLMLSLLAHGGLATIIVLYTSVGRGGVLFGNPHPLGGGGSAMITPVGKLPLPARGGPVNRLANDTESHVPLPPKPQPKAAPKPPPQDAISLHGRKQADRREQELIRRYQNYRAQPDVSNQIHSSVGTGLSSPMMGGRAGTGQIGMGPRSAFGYRFGWYRDLLEQKISEKWRTDDVDARIQYAPPVIVTFSIQRDGRVTDVRILQGSGNYSLDNSAKRAVFDSAPFQPLPQGFDQSSAQVEIWFQLKR